MKVTFAGLTCLYFQAVFFDLIPGWMDILGAGIIVLTILTTTFEAQIRSLINKFSCCNRGPQVEPGQEKGENETGEKEKEEEEKGEKNKTGIDVEKGTSALNSRISPEKVPPEDKSTIQNIPLVYHLDETDDIVNTLKGEQRSRC